MKTIRKIFDFCASHTLFRPDWDEAKNRAVFGKCSNPNGHGHNYELQVIVSGEIDPETGMIIDASKIDKIVSELVIQEVDHKDLNRDVAWLDGIIPTAENFVDAIWQRIEVPLSDSAFNARLEKLELWETRSICATRERI
ncbi:MAG: 6-carboxytetrahydropterin synthase [Bdellovibrionales bacterium]|nr:6-carboxytetrahydropterin synthase [Bdellovibrionales bacterium]